MYASFSFIIYESSKVSRHEYHATHNVPVSLAGNRHQGIDFYWLQFITDLAYLRIELEEIPVYYKHTSANKSQSSSGHCSGLPDDAPYLLDASVFEASLAREWTVGMFVRMHQTKLQIEEKTKVLLTSAVIRRGIALKFCSNFPELMHCCCRSHL